ncbi:MAG TPA: hypothetical protein VN372_03620 [Methanospirillum sp.]|nr:hypothetical protein [Methanospirillum sp.]
MKVGRNGIVAITFLIVFGMLFLVTLVNSGFQPDLKGILVVVYYSVWAAAFAFIIVTFIIPYIQEYQKNRRTEKPQSRSSSGIVHTKPPVRSAHEGLPLRERITEYVAERRREDGLPVPQPLRPSRTPSSPAGGRSGSGSFQTPPAHNLGATSAFTPGASESFSDGGHSAGDLPLPDDFGSNFDDSMDDDHIHDSSTGVGSIHSDGSLPGLDDDVLPGIEDFGGDDDLFSGSGDEPSLPAGLSDPGSSFDMIPQADLDVSGDSGLPDFDGDLDAGMAESDLMDDQDVFGLSGDDDLMATPDPSGPDTTIHTGGLSDDGLPDLDGSFDSDISESDFSGDEDLDDIEFMDLEPDEPPKTKNK